MTDSNIHSLPGGDTDKVKATEKTLERFMPEWEAQQPYIAKLRMTSYQAHLKAGFTEAQALQLCIHPSLTGH